ncbi:MAG: aspartate aminotransferase family protein [Pseudomonadota bacterium]
MSALMTTYAPLPVSFTHGIGAELFDSAGKAYLDGLSGIAVTNLGHAHAGVTEAITRQASEFLHCSNIFRIDAQERAGAALVERSGMESVFFCNSGAEANECAIKIARLHANHRGIEKPQIVVLEGAFHGRTLATLSAGGNRKIQAGFEPLVSGFLRAPRNDIDALKSIAASNRDIAAVFLEPVQGESGIHVLDSDYLQAVAALCKEQNWLLIFDEVQSGNGRTGSYFYYQQINVAPDVVTTAKALGNGVPVGACIARGEAAETFAPGNHGSTYGGNPLACAVAGAVLEAHAQEQWMERASPIRSALLDGFAGGLRHGEVVREVRGAGLMIGIELDRSCPEIVALALEQQLLLNVTAGSTVRLLPPLVMSDAQAKHYGQCLAAVVDSWAGERETLAGAA